MHFFNKSGCPVCSTSMLCILLWRQNHSKWIRIISKWTKTAPMSWEQDKRHKNEKEITDHQEVQRTKLIVRKNMLPSAQHINIDQSNYRCKLDLKPSTRNALPVLMIPHVPQQSWLLFYAQLFKCSNFNSKSRGKDKKKKNHWSVFAAHITSMIFKSFQDINVWRWLN